MLKKRNVVVGFNQKGSFDEIITQFLWFCSISDSSKRTPHPSVSATFSHEILHCYNFIVSKHPFSDRQKTRFM